MGKLMLHVSSPLFTNRFLYTFVLVAFLAGTAIGWANGEIRARDRATLADEGFYAGVYSTCFLYGGSMGFPVFMVVQICNDLVLDARDVDVAHDLFWLQGYAGQ